MIGRIRVYLIVKANQNSILTIKNISCLCKINRQEKAFQTLMRFQLKDTTYTKLDLPISVKQKSKRKGILIYENSFSVYLMVYLSIAREERGFRRNSI